MKTTELTGAALDWAVGMALGHDMSKAINLGAYLRIPAHTGSAYTVTFCPSTDWTVGGSIIEQEGIDVCCRPTGSKHNPEPDWASAKFLSAQEPAAFLQSGPTPLIAAMRCFVASKLGDDVNMPEGL